MRRRVMTVRHWPGSIGELPSTSPVRTQRRERVGSTAVDSTDQRGIEAGGLGVVLSIHNTAVMSLIFKGSEWSRCTWGMMPRRELPVASSTRMKGNPVVAWQSATNRAPEAGHTEKGEEGSTW